MDQNGTLNGIRERFYGIDILGWDVICKYLLCKDIQKFDQEQYFANYLSNFRSKHDFEEYSNAISLVVPISRNSHGFNLLENWNRRRLLHHYLSLQPTGSFLVQIPKILEMHKMYCPDMPHVMVQTGWVLILPFSGIQELVQKYRIWDDDLPEVVHFELEEPNSDM